MKKFFLFSLGFLGLAFGSEASMIVGILAWTVLVVQLVFEITYFIIHINDPFIVSTEYYYAVGNPGKIHIGGFESRGKARTGKGKATSLEDDLLAIYAKEKPPSAKTASKTPAKSPFKPPAKPGTRPLAPSRNTKPPSAPLSKPVFEPSLSSTMAVPGTDEAVDKKKVQEDFEKLIRGA